MSQETNSNDTRQIILEAAGEIFAQNGYRNTTIRKICKAAGTNLASINYYFGSKDRLYLEILKYSFTEAILKYPPDMGLDNTAPPVQRFHAFILSLLLRILDKGRPAWHGKLIAHELINPTPVFMGLAEETFVPITLKLEKIIEEIFGGKLKPAKLHLIATSVLGQCVFFSHDPSVIAKMGIKQINSRKDIEKLANHITRFSLSAIEGLRPR